MITILPFRTPFSASSWVIDCSELPADLVDREQRFRDWRFEPELRHPDLWAPWRWV